MLSNLTIHKSFWCLLFLFPVLYDFFGGVSNSQRVMHAIFFCLIALCALLKKRINISKPFLKAYSIYLLFVIIYYMFCTLFFTVENSWSDFADFSRPLIYTLYLFIPLIFPLESHEFEKIFRLLIKLIVLSIFFSMLVYLPETYVLVDQYKGRQSDDKVLMHFFRWSGTFGYPSDFSFVLSFFLYYLFFQFVYSVKSLTWRFYALLFLICVGIVFTLSRGGIFSSLFMLGICYLFSKAKFDLRINSILSFFSLAFISLMFYLYTTGVFDEFSDDIGYILAVFGDENGKVDSSTNHRLREVKLAYDYSINYFPFGSGSNRIHIKSLIDPLESFYGYHLIKWGVIGLMSHLVFIAYLAYANFKASLQFRKCNINLSVVFLATVTLLISVPLIFGFSSAMSDRFKCVAFYYVLAGYGLNFYLKSPGVGHVTR